MSAGREGEVGDRTLRFLLGDGVGGDGDEKGERTKVEYRGNETGLADLRSLLSLQPRVFDASRATTVSFPSSSFSVSGQLGEDVKLPQSTPTTDSARQAKDSEPSLEKVGFPISAFLMMMMIVDSKWI